MVTATLVNPGVVELPSVGASVQPPTAPIEVTLQRNETLSVKNRADGGREATMPLDQLTQYLRDQQAKYPDQAVVIAADKDIRYEAVLKLMDVLQQQHIKKVGLLVQPIPSS